MDEVALQSDDREEQVAELASKLQEAEAAATDGEVRLRELQEKLQKAQERWENVEKLEATGLEKELEERLGGLQEEHTRLQGLKEQVAGKQREDAEVKDEIATKMRAIVDTEKQLERSRKDLHEMRAKLAPLVKEQVVSLPVVVQSSL